MKEQYLFRALRGIDTKYILDAAPKERLPALTFARVSRKVLVPAVAIICCLAMLTSFFLLPMLFGKGDYPGANVVPPHADDPSDDAPIDKYPPNLEVPAGDLIFLTPGSLTSTLTLGSNIKGSNSIISGGASGSPPSFEFNATAYVVTARAIEELPDAYQTLPGGIGIYMNSPGVEYRIFRMRVIDSLGSGISGEFYYALPYGMKGDLCLYDTLLLSMQYSKEAVVKNASTGELWAFDIFRTAGGYPYVDSANVIPFNNNVFDESLWENKGWTSASWVFEINNYVERPLLTPEAKLKDVISRLKEKQKLDGGVKIIDPSMYEYESAEAKAAVEYIKPFANGIFVASDTLSQYYETESTYVRYIAGSPTNEWVSISHTTEKVKYSQYKFEPDDLVGIADLAAYVDSLDLSKIKPLHTDTGGKKLVSNRASAYYEKTANGKTYGIVKIYWEYQTAEYESTHDMRVFYDETFIIFHDNTAETVSREKLAEIIGDDKFSSPYEYGKPYEPIFE